MGVYRPGEGHCTERELKMVPLAFKGCLVYVHRKMAWLHHRQMTELTHVCKGSHSCVIRR